MRGYRLCISALIDRRSLPAYMPCMCKAPVWSPGRIRDARWSVFIPILQGDRSPGRPRRKVGEGTTVPIGFGLQKKDNLQSQVPFFSNREARNHVKSLPASRMIQSRDSQPILMPMRPLFLQCHAPGCLVHHTRRSCYLPIRLELGNRASTNFAKVGLSVAGHWARMAA